MQRQKKMVRLTTDDPKNNVESAHNIFSIKDRTTVCKLTEGGHEITLYDLMRHCGEVLHCRVAYDGGTDNDIGEFLTDSLFDGLNSPEGILAHFFTTAWAYSELRAKLKAYEDTGIEPDGINNSTASEESDQQQLCNEDENFVQTKFGYCFYTLDSEPWIYNLYVHPQYRRCSHSHELLKLVIAEIRKSGYEGEIRIAAEPKENSIGQADLAKYYERMGLIVREVNKPNTNESKENAKAHRGQ